MTAEGTTELRDDLVIGAEAVARFLGMTTRQVYGCVERRTIPFFKIGSQICLRRSVMMEWIAKQEHAAMRVMSEPGEHGSG